MKERIYGDPSIVSSTAFILPNRLAGRHTEEHAGDLGERSRRLSSVVGLPVIAYERPGTATASRVKPFNEHSLLSRVTETAGKLAEISEYNGFSNLYIAGHSAAAAEAILVTDTELLPISKLLAFDPVMMRTSQPSYSFAVNWMKHQARSAVERGLKKYPEVAFFGDIKTEKSNDDKRHTTVDGLKEARSYLRIYPGNLALEALSRVKKQEGLTTHLYLGENTDVLDPVEIEEVFNEDPGNIIIEVIPGADHGFAEPYNYFNHLVSQCLDS